MPDKIQRVARGVNETLSLQGGYTPTLLLDEVRANIDLLQFYGLQQRQVLQANNAALAEGAGLQLPVTPSWGVLFSAAFSVVVTATMTALSFSVLMVRGASDPVSTVLACREVTVFGATVTGTVHVTFFAPYPLLLPPGSSISGGMGILGTDATANCTVRAEFGFFG